jgi:two-component system chemotaxis response regulator CheB
MQHIEESFLPKLANEISDELGLKLGKISQKGEVLKDSRIYLATEPYHIQLVRSGYETHIKYHDKHPVNGHRPSIDELFLSAAETKANFLTMLLTGMGGDGAK